MTFLKMRKLPGVTGYGIVGLKPNLNWKVGNTGLVLLKLDRS